MKIRPIQREMKIIRAKRSLRLMDVADALRMAPAYLCSIEVGDRPAPSDFESRVSELLCLSEEERTGLISAIQESIKIFRLDDSIPLERRTKLSASFSQMLLSTDDDLD